MKSLKKVLIITYYWPPSGGAGVQRWLKFVKYLRNFGWEPVVYTPLNPEMPARDESLINDIPDGIEIIRTPVWEPYSYYKRLSGMKRDETISAGFLKEKKKSSIAETIAIWVRSNFFIPDARKFWIKPSVKFLSAYLKNNPVDVVVSSGPPHSMHMIALALKKKFDISWIADFRDPWTGIDFYHQLKLTKWADSAHHKLEREVLSTADEVITISRVMSEEFTAIVNRSYQLIPNGYDEADLEPLPLNQLDPYFSIAHIGSIQATRNPSELWKVLAEKVNEDSFFRNNLKIKLTGRIDYSVMEELRLAGLSEHVIREDYMPHARVVDEMQKCQVLLLLVNNTPTAKGIVTGKLFEYLAAKRPILAIGPEDGEAARIITETRSGKIAGFDQPEKMKEILQDYFIRFREQRLLSECTGIEAYSRKELTGTLSAILDKYVR